MVTAPDAPTRPALPCRPATLLAAVLLFATPGAPCAAADAAHPDRPASGAQTLDARTRADIEGVITAQLQAFERDDAAGAEAFAAPGIRERFPEPSAFLAMVKQQYGALIHPRSTQFAGVAEAPGGPLQRVVVIAADGTVWAAIYSFERVDGAWRITGCGLEKDGSQQAI